MIDMIWSLEDLRSIWAMNLYDGYDLIDRASHIFSEAVVSEIYVPVG